MSKRAFFFDMDGVLFDSMPGHSLSWNQTMQHYGFDFNPMGAYLNEGRTGFSVISELIEKQYGRPATKDEVDEIYAMKTRLFRELGETQPMRGVRQVLDYLRSRECLIYIVTGSGQLSLFERLNHSFPGIFTRERMVTAFDVKKGKPDPEPYLIAWQKTGLHKDECVVIENAPLGVQAGHASGITTIGVNTGPLPDELLWKAGADYVLPDMEALLHLIKNPNFNLYNPS